MHLSHPKTDATRDFGSMEYIQILRLIQDKQYSCQLAVGYTKKWQISEYII